MAIELRVIHVPVNSNRTCAARSFKFEITYMILDQIALHSVQLPLFTDWSKCIGVVVVGWSRDGVVYNC